MAREVMHSSKLCLDCLATKYLFETDKVEYTNKVKELIASVKDFDTGHLEVELIKIYDQYFEPKDYPKIKKHYNDLVISLLPKLINKIDNSIDPLYTVIKMSIVSNYIDYSAYHSVDDNKLVELLSDVDKYEFKNYKDLLDQLAKSTSLLYISDNCGEVVIDKLVISYIHKYYPNIKITAMVRGAEVVNDASMNDANYINLQEVCTVVDNGIDRASSKPSELPIDRQELMKSSDLIISKGQANAETLSCCGLNVFYLLLVKCDYFAQVFKVNKMTPLIEKELI